MLGMSSGINSTNDIRFPIKGIIRYGALNKIFGHFCLVDIESYRECLGYFTAEDMAAQVPKEENSLIKRVFGFTAGDGSERKIEVMLTGGDWMQYALIYFITNAGPDKDKVSAYFIPQLSTPDRENGEVPPAIDPNDLQKLADFIVNGFLNADGSVKADYTSVVPQ